MTNSATPLQSSGARKGFDIGPITRTAVWAAGGAMTAACLLALARAALGWAPEHLNARYVAVVIHIATVVPSVPLGAWLLLNRKGTKLHKSLGKLWIVLMVVTALAAIFIKTSGQFSFIHIFVPLTLLGAFQAIRTAKRGDIEGHKKQLVRLYLLALIIPGVFAFTGNRLMGAWLFG